MKRWRGSSSRARWQARWTLASRGARRSGTRQRSSPRIRSRTARGGSTRRRASDRPRPTARRSPRTQRAIPWCDPATPGSGMRSRKRIDGFAHSTRPPFSTPRRASSASTARATRPPCPRGARASTSSSAARLQTVAGAPMSRRRRNHSIPQSRCSRSRGCASNRGWPRRSIPMPRLLTRLRGDARIS